jgi:hypothetical protein
MKALLAILGVLLIVGAIGLGVWLCLYVLLYGGIMQAINNWGVDTPAVVWGIIRAVFFQMGAIPAYLMGLLGMVFVGAAAS